MVRVRPVDGAKTPRIDADGGMIPGRWFGCNARGTPLPHGELVPDGYHVRRLILQGALEECPPPEADPAPVPEAHAPEAPVKGRTRAVPPTVPGAPTFTPFAPPVAPPTPDGADAAGDTTTSEARSA
jgi:hypothetical protein